jgi:hypothetical protein
MAVETAVRTDSPPDDDAPARRRWGVGDYVFLALFIAFTVGSIGVLAQGLGAVAAHLSKSLHASFDLRGFGIGPTARAAHRMAKESLFLPSTATIALGYAFSFFNLALAIFLLWLRPRDRTARLLAIALVGTAGVFNLTAQATLEALPLTPTESVIQAGAHILTGLAYVYALVLFPDGRPVPRWRWPLLAALYLPATAAAVFLALRVQGNSRPGTLLLFFGLGVPVAGVAAQAYRFRRAATIAVAQQARLLFWALLPALGIGIWFVVTQGPGAANVGLAGRHLTEQPVLIFKIFQPVFLLVPVALFIGLLRYRLWDIDRVINRTLVYGLATGILFGAYLGIVVLLQRLFNRFTGGSSFAVALSTLTVAAAFIPVRQWIQDFVDRRFYRHRYDAQKTIEAFSTRLRDELDMEALTSELRSAVAQTMQPAAVSLLLKDPDSGAMSWQWTYRPRGRS